VKNIIAIDPGPDTSGIVILKFEKWPPSVVMAMRDAKLDDIRKFITEYGIDTVIVEWLTSYGSVVGRTVLDTARIVGRVQEMAFGLGCIFGKMTRPDVGLELCQTKRAKGANLSEAIREIYHNAKLDIGGGSDPCRGTKKEPGPLYGIALGEHEGSALAVGLAWLRTKLEGRL
jgi:hypothetical protein